MSVDIDWDTITCGPDGTALAAKIREFVHQKFQQVTLPRFINSVHVHSFDFGKTCPEIEIKDVCDPLPDFYEDEDEDDEDDETGSTGAEESPGSLASNVGTPAGAGAGSHFDPVKADPLAQGKLLARPQLANILTRADSAAHGMTSTAKDHYGLSADPMAGPFPRSNTPGIPGGTSNLGYFHFPAGGLSGAQTPLAAVASGTPFTPRPWAYDFGHGNMHAGLGDRTTGLRKGERSINSRDDPSTRPSTATSISSPLESESGLSSPRLGYASHGQGASGTQAELDAESPLSPLRVQSRQPSDVQVVTRVKYSGDVRMTLTAEILLDYPMPSFVGIPLKLAITGMTFDGVAIVALIKKKMHFCFLDPEDAAALLGEVPVDIRKDKGSKDGSKATSAGLLQEIHVESEIGRQEDGKQVLKNVGKVEKFVLEQVRKIFEEEFVFPSYWTFLV
ncbi:hypothetical protein LTR84_013056 [Exophiala bonariae]|uniref:Mitochondrial distribution and morphology protein 12 n=1 Tax=Exophiala bonariae TaxID=1690606 RepID=A0AAV9NH87_9EURO|nr:hypothetical protein LTR84_013056 [Exophiala bonariae]